MAVDHHARGHRLAVPQADLHCAFALLQLHRNAGAFLLSKIHRDDGPAELVGCPQHPARLIDREGIKQLSIPKNCHPCDAQPFLTILRWDCLNQRQIGLCVFPLQPVDDIFQGRTAQQSVLLPLFNQTFQLSGTAVSLGLHLDNLCGLPLCHRHIKLRADFVVGVKKVEHLF